MILAEACVSEPRLVGLAEYLRHAHAELDGVRQNSCGAELFERPRGTFQSS